MDTDENRQLANSILEKVRKDKDESYKGLGNLPRIAGYFNVGHSVEGDNATKSRFDLKNLTSPEDGKLLTPNFKKVLDQLNSTYPNGHPEMQISNTEETAELIAGIHAKLVPAEKKITEAFSEPPQPQRPQ